MLGTARNRRKCRHCCPQKQRPRIAALALAASVLLGARCAAAQEIEPNDLIPLPPGTNLFLAYYEHANDTAFNFANGGTYTQKTGMQVNLGAGRYLYYFDLGDHPAALQILQIFGSESGAEIGGQSLGSAFGAADIALNAAIWPYANRRLGQYLVLVAWLYPPSGTYDPASPLNLGANRWAGDAQIGWHQQIASAFSFDLSFDAMIYGDNDDAYPGGARLSQDPTYRLQAWANWQCTRRLTAAFGYEGFFGGDQSLDGVFTGQKTEEQRLRFTVSYFITPRVQALVELNHDVQVVGGFEQQFGTILRLAFAF